LRSSYHVKVFFDPILLKHQYFLALVHLNSLIKNYIYLKYWHKNGWIVSTPTRKHAEDKQQTYLQTHQCSYGKLLWFHV